MSPDGPARRGRRACALGALLLALSGALSCVDAGSHKKLIECGWDEPGPAFMREHIAQMEASPFDGCVYHLDYTKPDSTTGSFTWECWGRRAFTDAELARSLEDLRATPFRRFRENFLRFNATPGDLDWFDDYSAVVSNARQAARIARAAGSRGIWLDPEQYQGQLFDYSKQRDAATRSWAGYAAQARRRGREVMQAFQEGYPGLTVFLAFAYSWPMTEVRLGKQPLSKCRYGLLAPFLDGMLEAASGATRMVDGDELAYNVADPAQLDAAYRLMKLDVLPIVADPTCYARVFSFSFGIWMDYDWKKYGWHVDHPERNHHSPQQLRALIRKALETADEYVWVYSEQPRWWSARGGTQRLPPSVADAVRRARDAVIPQE